MKKAYRKQFDEKLFQVRYVFFVGNKKLVNKALKKEFKDRAGLGDNAAEAFDYHYPAGAMVQCLWVPSKKVSDYLIHEITHCVINTLEKKGQPITRTTGETAAYLSGYLYREFVNKKKWKRIK